MSACGVCPFVTFVSCAKTNKDIFEIFSPSGSHTTLVFFTPNRVVIIRREPPNGGVECKGGMKKWRFSTNISLYLRNGYSYRWVHSARQFVSIEFPFHHTTFSVIAPAASPGKQKCGKKAIFGLTHWLKHRITLKLLKIDMYMLRGVWQALNCLSNHATYCVIIAGASPGETINVGCGTWKPRFLPRDAMQARSLLSCSVCPSVRLSVRHVRGSRQNE